jgi:hypothetical protein
MSVFSILNMFKSFFIRDKKLRGRVVSDYEYNDLRKMKEDETNRILEKISKKGVASLTEKEKKFLGR